MSPTPNANEEAQLSPASLEQWLGDYAAAWTTRDPDAVVEIFTKDARYYQTPYEEPFVGREGIRQYWRDVTSDQKDVSVECDAVGVIGDTGVARWRATFTSISHDSPVELNGVFILKFTQTGLCSELREWWHAR